MTLDLPALIRREALDLGFDLCGFTQLDDPGLDDAAARLEAWLAAGMHATLTWMEETAALRADLRKLVPWAEGAVALWWGHRVTEPAPPPPIDGRVSSYATQRDYHNVLHKALKKLRRRVSAHDPGIKMHLAVDSGPVPDRTLAYLAGLGFFGRSTMLINPKLGTYGALAVVLINRPVPKADPLPNLCGRCTACVDACPTQAISEAGVDARRCVSHWTIEHKAPYPEGIAETLGAWVFGCDVCQQVCPWNRRAPSADAGVWRPRPELAAPSLIEWLGMETEALHEHARGTPLRRAGGVWLKRAACVALGNLGGAEAEAALRGALEAEEPEVRGAAEAALRRLSLE